MSCNTYLYIIHYNLKLYNIQIINYNYEYIPMGIGQSPNTEIFIMSPLMNYLTSTTKI